MAGSASQTVGAAQALTISATDPYGNTDTGYAGAKNLTFSGANSSTSPVTAPTVTNNAAAAINFGSTTAVTFTAGVSSSGGSMKLYKAEAATIAVTDGTLSAAGGDRLAVTVNPAAATRLVVTGSSPQTAGAAQALTITATDQYGNADTSYAGAKSLTFSGANSSANPVTAPTVTNNAAVAINFGSTTAVTFTAGVSSSGGSMKLYKAEAATIAVSDGTLSAVGTDRLSVTVNPGAATRLIVTGSSPQTAGTAQALTITATDAYGNTDTTYAGAKSLTFSGANSSTSPVTAPTVTNNAAAAISFGSATAVTFTAGVSSSGGSMKLYKAEAATIAVTDGTISAAGSDRLPVTVNSAAATRLVVTGSSPQTAGTAQALTIKATDPYGNTDTTYAGAKSLTFSGANSSTNPVTAPTVTNNAATGINFGSTTAITFTNGVSSSGGSMKLYKAEAATIAVTDGTLSAAGTDRLPVTVNPAAATRLVVTGTSPQTAGTAQALTITAADPYGNTDTTYTGAKSLTFSGANSSTNPVTAPTVTNNAAAAIAFGSTTAVTFTNGVSTSGGSMKLYKAENATIAATDGTLSATGTDRLSVLVNSAAATRLVVTGTSPQSAGTSQVLTITATDPYGNTDLAYAGAKNLTFSGANSSTNPVNAPTVTNNAAAAIVFGSTTAVTFTNGVSSSGGTMKLYKAESATIAVTDGTLSAAGGDRLAVTVNPAAATRLVVTGTGPQTAGTAQALTITATDPYGNTDTGYTGAKNLTFSGASSSTSPATAPTVTNNAAAAIAFGSTTAVTFTNGVSSTGGSMKLYKAENATIAVTDGTLSAAGTDRLPVTVNPAAATRLVVTGSAGQTAGTAQALAITATDPYGNTDTGYAGSKNLTFSGANSSTNPATAPTVTNSSASAIAFGSTTAVTFTNGVSTSGGSMKLYKAENATIAVTDGTLSAAGTDRLPVTVNPVAATRLVVTGSSSQTVGTAQALTITATDAYGNTDTTYAGAKSLTFSGANSSTSPVTAPTVTNNAAAAIAFGSVTAITFTNGVSSTGGSMKLYKVEAATIAVTDGTLSAAGTDRLPVTVNPAAATRLVVTGSAAQTAGAAQALTIKATDPYGNTDTSYAGAKSLTFSGANSSTSPVTAPTVTNNAAAAIAFGSTTAVTFTAGVSSSGGSMKLYKAESATIAVTDGTISAAGADRLGVTVSSAAATRLVVAGSASQTVGAAQALTISATDPYGNTDTGYAGAKNLTFSGANSSTSPVTAPTVTNNAAAAINFGSTTAVTFTAGVSSSGGSMKLYKAEAATIAVTDGTLSAAGGDRLAVTVNPAAATRLVVTGSSPQTAGAAQALTITATDQYGNADTSYAGAKSLTFSGANSSANPVTAPTVTNNAAVAINFGSTTAVTFTAGVSSSGGSMKLYKAEAATIAVSDGTLSAVGTDRLSVTVNPGAATRLIVTGSSPQTAGTAQALTITATDAYGNTDTTYAGAKSLTFSGANSSTSPVTAPTVTNNAAAAISFGSATAVTFTAGVSSSGGSMKLYKAEAATIAVTDGTISAAGSDRLPVTVNSAAATRLVVTGSSPQTAGTAQALTIKATDPYGNTDTTYAGAKSLTFSGANSSTNPVTAPTVTNNAATGINFGSTTAITFTNGVSSSGGSMKLYKAEAATIAVTDGTLSAAGTDRLPVTVNPAAATRLVVTGTSPQTAGTAQALTITAADPYGNTDTTYTGAKSLTFSGANSSTNPVTAPTVTNNAAAAIAFGSTTAVTFTNGVSTSGGSMKLYKAENATIAATDGTLSATGTDRLSVLVNSAAATRLVVTGTSPQSAGGSQTATVTATDPYGNADTSYAGNKNITFSGAGSSSNPVTAPTFRDRNAVDQPSARPPRSPSRAASPRAR